MVSSTQFAKEGGTRTFIKPPPCIPGVGMQRAYGFRNYCTIVVHSGDRCWTSCDRRKGLKPTVFQVGPMTRTRLACSGPSDGVLRIIGVLVVAVCTHGCARNWARPGADAADLQFEAVAAAETET